MGFPDVDGSTKCHSDEKQTASFFFFFFSVDYCAPRGTEPHVALQIWDDTRNVTRTNGLWLCRSPLNFKLTLRNTGYLTADEYNYVTPKDWALCRGKSLII